MRDWPKTLAEVVDWLRRRERPTVPTPHGAPPFNPDAPPAPPINRTCRYCGIGIPDVTYARHVLWHQERGDKVPEL